ncbi:MAG: hypothetical protein JWQ72_2223 [Polaromonas sp.]|nr:hypothetical protein [Polaromonas sp.]
MVFVSRTLRDFLTHVDAWLIIHFAVTAVPAWFCFVFLVGHGDTFATGGGSYSQMAAVGNETQWALACGIIALSSGIAWWIRQPVPWFIACGMLAAWHGFVALSVWRANSIGTGAGAYAIYAFLATVKMARPFHAPSTRCR